MKSLLLFVLFLLTLSFSSCNNDKSTDTKEGTPLEEATKAIEKDADNPKLYIQRAEIYEKKQDFNNAIIDVQKAIQLDNTNYDNFLKLADLFLATNQIQGCINSLNAILADDPKHIGANLKMAELNLMFKRYSAALTSANTVLTNDPYNSKAFFIKGFTLKESGDTASAIRNFIEAIKNNPEYYEADVELGNLFRSKKDPIAISYYQNAIKLKPKNTDAYYNLGIFYQENDMLNKAQEAYRKIIELDPKFPYSYFNIGYILLEVSRTPDEAVKYFAKAIEQKPDYYEAHYNLGLCLEEMGDIQNARESYKNALKYHNNYPKAIEGLNRIDEIMKR